MENNEGYIEFLSSENNKNEIDAWYRTYNIVYEKTQLFKDFIIPLLDLLDSTYLGEEFMEHEEDKRNHFLWCINKIITNFEKEKIYFKKEGVHIEYLWSFFLKTFYQSDNHDKLERIREYLSEVFVFNYTKTKTDLELLTEFYIILNQNLKK